jgi:cyclopropane-fatty-acyl-phospholipid synthase
MDKNAGEIMQLFSETYGTNEAILWVQRWRIFFMSCAELFGYSKGNEWLVAHYLFSKQS